MSDVDEHFSALVKGGAWLDAQTFPPLQWAVHGLVPEGFGLLVGPPKAGKSWAALSIALALASGGRAFGKVLINRPRPVLYLALEDGDRRLQDRCRMLLGTDPIPPLFEYATSPTPAEAVQLMAWWIAKQDDDVLVLLDTLGKVSPPSAPGESAYARDYRIGTTLKRLVDERPGSTLLAVHHDRKAGAEDFVDSVSGTHGLAGSSDFMLVLDRKRHEADGLIKVTGRDVREGEYAISLSDSGQWTLKGDDLAAAAAEAVTKRATADLGDRSAEIIAFIAERGAAVTPTDVTNELNIKDARRYLARLADSGRLVKLSRGLYGSVPSVPLSQEDNVVRPLQWDNGTDGTRGGE